MDYSVVADEKDSKKTENAGTKRRSYSDEFLLKSFQVLFVAKDHGIVWGSTIAELFGLICSLQLASLCFSPALLHIWPKYMWSSSKKFGAIMSLGVLHSEGAFFTTFWVWTALIAIAYMLAGLCYCMCSKNYEHNVFFKIWTCLSYTSQTVLQTPVLVALTRAVADPATHGILPGDSGTILNLNRVVGISLIAAYICIAMGFSLTIFHHVPFGDNGKIDFALYSMPHGRIECLSVIGRATCTIIVAIISSSGSQSTAAHLVLAVTVAVVGFVLWFAYMYFVPFFSFKSNLFAVLGFSIPLWAGVCTILGVSISHEPDNSPAVLFLVVVPIFVYSSAKLFVYRVSHASKMPFKKIKGLHPYIIEATLRIRFKNKMLQQKKPFSFEKDAENAYCNIVTYCSSPFLALHVASLAQVSGKLLMFSLKLIQRVRKENLLVDTRFMLFCHNKVNSKRQQATMASALFDTVEKYVELATTALQEALKYQAAFWKMALSKNVWVSDTLIRSRYILSKQEECRMYLERVNKIHVDSVPAMHLQVLYHHYVTGETDSALKIMERMAEKNRVAENTKQCGSVAMCTISGNEEDLGAIIHASLAMRDVFGYSTAELTGRNVNILCPAPFDRFHDSFLRQFIASDSPFDEVVREVYGLHKNGTIFPVQLSVTPGTNENSDIILLGKFVRLQLDKHVLLVEPDSGIVTAVSENASQVLDIDTEDVLLRQLRIRNIFPDFYDPATQQLSYLEPKSVCLDNQSLFPFKVHAIPIKYASKPGSAVDFSCDVVVVTVVVEKTGVRRHTTIPGVSALDVTTTKTSIGSHGSSSHGSDSYGASGAMGTMVHKQLESLHKGETKLNVMEYSKHLENTAANHIKHLVLKNKLKTSAVSGFSLIRVFLRKLLLSTSVLIIFLTYMVVSNYKSFIGEIGDVCQSLDLPHLTAMSAFALLSMVSNGKNDTFIHNELQITVQDARRKHVEITARTEGGDLGILHIEGLNYLNRIEKLAKQENRYCDSACMGSLQYGVEHLYVLYERHIDSELDRLQRTVKKVNTSSAVISLLCCVGVFSLLLAAVTPVIRAQWLQEKRITECLLHIPEKVCKKLATVNERRLRYLSKRQTKSNSDSTDSTEGANLWDDKGNHEVNRKNKNQRYVICATRLEKLALFLRIMYNLGSLLLLVLVAFVVLVYLEDLHQNDFSQAIEILHTEGIRTSLVSVLLFWYAYEDMDKSNASWNKTAIETTISKLKKHHRQLLFGDEGNNIPAFTKTEGAHYNLWYSNACLQTCMAHREDLTSLKGLEHGLDYFFSRFIVEISRGLQNQTATATLEHFGEFQVLAEFTKSLLQSKRLFLEDIHVLQISLQDRRLWLTSLLIALLGAGYLVASKEIEKMGKEAEKNLKVLSLFPADFFRRNQDLVKEI